MATDAKKIEQWTESFPELTEKLAEMDAKHPEIAVVNTAKGPAIFRRPTRVEYKRHLAMIFDEKKRADAAEFLALATCVHPPREVFLAWVEEKAGIPLACADVLSELAGASKKEDEGK